MQTREEGLCDVWPCNAQFVFSPQKRVKPIVYTCTGEQVYIMYGTCHKKLYEIHGNSARNPQSFCATIRGIAVLLPRRVSPISAE